MRSIKISDEVWQEIANRGKFGETEDDVLRRVFSLSPEVETAETQDASVSGSNGRSSHHYARKSTRRISQYISNGRLYVEIERGPQKSWSLPQKSEKLKIKEVRDLAVDFARDHSATVGQVNAVMKALTSNGYYITK